MVFRSTHYVGCGVASKTLKDGNNVSSMFADTFHQEIVTCIKTVGVQEPWTIQSSAVPNVRPKDVSERPNGSSR
jgi:hypothetical protein